MNSNLKSRYDALHREMVEQFERTAAVENRWLMYTLLGWEHLATCAVSHYLLEIRGLQDCWPYVVLWLGQILVAIGTVMLVTSKPRVEESPLEPINKRIWLMFIFLCINVAVLNVVAGQKIFVFLPALAALSSFGFVFLTHLISRKFFVAGIWMFITGILMARYAEYGFLIYGTSWLAVLQTLGIVFLRKRKRWLRDESVLTATD